MLKHLIDLRDFSYVMLKKRGGEARAENEYKFQVMAFCCVYNLIIVSVFLITVIKLGVTLSSIMQGVGQVC